MKIFIANDSSLIRNRIAAATSEIPGLQVSGQAGNTVDAIQALKAHSPDAVILDLRMPGGGGMEVLEQIQNRNKRSKVIVFTNYPYPQYRTNSSCVW